MPSRARVFPVVLISALLATACSSDETAVAPAAPSLSVSVAVPSRVSLPRRVTASGSIAAWEEMVLGVELSGQRIDRIHVEVGDVVQAGDALLTLDTRTLEMERRQAEATLAQADANLQVAAANARRGERLKREQLIASSEADQLIAGELTAKAQRQSALAQLESARLRSSFATLRAPDDGVISARLAQPGQVVAAGAELLRLIRDGRLEWRAELPEAELIRIAPGVPVELQAPDGARVEGTVRAVSPSLDARSRTGVVYADLPAPGSLRAGMYAAGDLLLGAAPARTVPEQAIVERDGYRYLFVVGDGDVVAQRRVETGARQDGVVEIRDGIADDDRIVVDGAGFLSDGDRVRVVPADAATATGPAGGDDDTAPAAAAAD
jgi:RND family efflux transporter MFP subunit